MSTQGTPSQYVCETQYSEYSNALADCEVCGWPIGRHKVNWPKVNEKGPFKPTDAPKCAGSMGCHVHWSGWPATHHPNCTQEQPSAVANTQSLPDCKHGFGPNSDCDWCRSEYIDGLKAEIERLRSALSEIANYKGWIWYANVAQKALQGETAP